MGYVIKIECEELIPFRLGKWIFAVDVPEKNDLFYITVSSDGAKTGKISGAYCDWNPAHGPPWENYHSGVDIFDEGTNGRGVISESHIYPVRNGTLVAADYITSYNGVGQYDLVVNISPGVFDVYAHVSGDMLDQEIYSPPIQIYSTGPFADRLASFTVHESLPHLHYGVRDEEVLSFNSKSIRNPLNPDNDLIPFIQGEPVPAPPVIIDRICGNDDPGIYFREDDYLMVPPYPTPDLADTTIGGKVDIEARMMDYNGASYLPGDLYCGVNRIAYHLYYGLDTQSHYLESRVFLD